MLEKQSLEVLTKALDQLESGFAQLPDLKLNEESGRMEAILIETASRLHNNYPYFHPLYAGQMLKPPHPIARAAYALAMWINPNNHALDGGRESSAMEREAVAEIASMFGWQTHLGHLCGGGTMANLEALWVSGKLHPGKTIVASSQAHYTHHRISAALGLPFESIPCDALGRMDTNALEAILSKGHIGTVVATLGTTATGSVDPLSDLIELKEKFGFRLHADTAYGGYFVLSDTLEPHARNAFDQLTRVDSIVIDPHKHGLQPYGCGCVLFRDPSVGKLYKHDSPYTYFSSQELHLGEISLECSRAGAAAVALRATQKLLPNVRGGDFARQLDKGRAAALQLHTLIRKDQRFTSAFAPELDILIWLPRAETTSAASALSRSIFEECARRNLHLALAELPTKFFQLQQTGTAAGKDSVTCLRSVLMKPEHLEWVPEIWRILSEATDSL